MQAAGHPSCVAVVLWVLIGELVLVFIAVDVPS